MMSLTKVLSVFGLTLIGLVAPFVDLGCERHPSKPEGIAGSGVSGGTRSSRDGAAPSTPRTSLPPGDVSIAVIPTDTIREFVLRFCYAGEARFDPQIDRVVIAHVGATREKWCELSATGGAWLWREWKVGIAPKDFRVRNCSGFEAGEYEILVDGFVGHGSARIAIDTSGTVRRLPWDTLSGVEPASCPSPRTKPELIPKQNEGDVGPLEKRSADLQQRRTETPRQ